MENYNIGCKKCGMCCYLKYEYYPPSVNVLEIRKIEKLTGMDGVEFTENFPERWTIYTVLRYIKDENGDRHCMFLKNNDGGTKTCSIYDIRPITCKKYPKESRKCVSGRVIYPRRHDKIKNTIIAKANSMKKLFKS